MAKYHDSDMPDRDRPALEIEITEEMIWFGVQTIYDWMPDALFAEGDAERLVSRIYEGMARISASRL